jgi:hypothetical protein
LVDFDEPASHHLSHNEIGSDNPCSRHLSGIGFVEEFYGMQPGSIGLHVEFNHDSGEFAAPCSQMLHHLCGRGVQTGVGCGGAFAWELRALNVVKERPLAMFQALSQFAVDGLEMRRRIVL